MFFEDFSPGQAWTTRGRTITEADVVQFAGLTGDYTGLHMDAVEAAESPFGRRIAHGALIFSVSNGLKTQLNLIKDTVIAFYGVDRLRFTKPVFFGDTIKVSWIVTDLTPKSPGRGVVSFSTEVKNQRGEVVLIYTDKVLVKARE
jgi:acyl dehydratase